MTIADKANQLVNNDRQKDYDHPSKNFLRIAELWQGFCNAKGWQVEIDPLDVADMMLLVKMGREMFKHKDDNLVDEVGYILCRDKMINEDVS